MQLGHFLPHFLWPQHQFIIKSYLDTPTCSAGAHHWKCADRSLTTVTLKINQISCCPNKHGSPGCHTHTGHSSLWSVWVGPSRLLLLIRHIVLDVYLRLIKNFNWYTLHFSRGKKHNPPLYKAMFPRRAEEMYFFCSFLFFVFLNGWDDNDDLTRATELLPNPPPPMKPNKQHAVITPLIKCLLSSNWTPDCGAIIQCQDPDC